MREGNKIEAKNIKTHSFTIARCGWLLLICNANPYERTFEYEIQSNGKIIFQSYDLQSAIVEYNRLVI